MKGEVVADRESCDRTLLFFPSLDQVAGLPFRAGSLEIKGPPPLALLNQSRPVWNFAVTFERTKLRSYSERTNFPIGISRSLSHRARYILSLPRFLGPTYIRLSAAHLDIPDIQVICCLSRVRLRQIKTFAGERGRGRGIKITSTFKSRRFEWIARTAKINPSLPPS